jgi:hypothetical protein
MVLIIVGVIVLVLLAFVIAAYNGLVRLNQQSDEAWSDITVQLKRGVVRDFNTKRKTFPTNIFAGMLGFNKDKEYFELDEAGQAAAEKPVDVKF